MECILCGEPVVYELKEDRECFCEDCMNTILNDMFDDLFLSDMADVVSVELKEIYE